MKRITLMLILFSMLLFVVGCTSDKAVDSKTVLPDNIPNFIEKVILKQSIGKGEL